MLTVEKEFKFPSKLKEHLKSHENELMHWDCESCDKSYKRLDRFRKHAEKSCKESRSNVAEEYIAGINDTMLINESSNMDVETNNGRLEEEIEVYNEEIEGDMVDDEDIVVVVPLNSEIQDRR